MIYFLYLAWVLAVRRDTQGNQWNVQTCRTVCNERVRRTDAMMRCHRRYAIAMAHLFPVIRNKSGAWSSGRECLRSEETHRTPSYLPISTIFHSATMGQSEHKIPIFLSSVEVITGGNLLKLCIIRQRFPALVCWKPKLHLDVSTTESEISGANFAKNSCRDANALARHDCFNAPLFETSDAMAQTEGSRSTLQRQKLLCTNQTHRNIQKCCWHAVYVACVRVWGPLDKSSECMTVAIRIACVYKV